MPVQGHFVTSRKCFSYQIYVQRISLLAKDHYGPTEIDIDLDKALGICQTLVHHIIVHDSGSTTCPSFIIISAIYRIRS
jgi:hypothetical protein